MSDLVNRAKDLATRAHAGQVDKAGRPYIEHVRRVADTVAATGDDHAVAVAWLHDVMEDAPQWWDANITQFPSRIGFAVYDLTRGDGGDDFYYWRIRQNPLALLVKLADIADNSDEARLALLDDKTAARLRRKYAKALKCLGQGDAA